MESLIGFPATQHWSAVFKPRLWLVTKLFRIAFCEQYISFVDVLQSLSLFRIGSSFKLSLLSLAVGTEEFLFCSLTRMRPVKNPNKNAALLLSCPLSHQLFPHPINARLVFIYIYLIEATCFSFL